MNGQRKHPFRRAPQRGATLVELMVSIAIGMLVVLAATAVFLVQKRGYDTQDESARMQEGARVALVQLQRDLRLAGYFDVVRGDILAQPALEVADAADLNRSDRITVRYFGSSNLAGNADASIVDCTGTAVPAGTLRVSTYYIATDATSGEPGLWCVSGGAARLLVAGVESMQVLVGEDPADTGAITSLRPAATATAGVTPAAGSGASATLNSPRSAMVSLLMRSQRQGQTSTSGTKHSHFGTTYASGNVAPANDPGAVFTAPADNRLRRLYSVTVGLRNSLD